VVEAAGGETAAGGTAVMPPVKGAALGFSLNLRALAVPVADAGRAGAGEVPAAAGVAANMPTPEPARMPAATAAGAVVVAGGDGAGPGVAEEAGDGVEAAAAAEAAVAAGRTGRVVAAAGGGVVAAAPVASLSAGGRTSASGERDITGDERTTAGEAWASSRVPMVARRASGDERGGTELRLPASAARMLSRSRGRRVAGPPSASSETSVSATLVTWAPLLLAARDGSSPAPAFARTADRRRLKSVEKARSSARTDSRVVAAFLKWCNFLTISAARIGSGGRGWLWFVVATFVCSHPHYETDSATHVDHRQKAIRPWGRDAGEGRGEGSEGGATDCRLWGGPGQARGHPRARATRRKATAGASGGPPPPGWRSAATSTA